MKVRSLLLPTACVALGLSACSLKGGGDDGAEPAPTVTVTQTVTETPTASTPSTPPASSTPTSTPPTADGPTTSTATSQPTTTGPVDLSQPPATYDAAIAHIAAATGSVQAKRFLSPSGNIYCTLKDPYVGSACELGRGGIPDSDYCGNNPASTAVGRIELDHGQATPVCNSDTIRTGNPPAQLPYGTVAQTSGTAVECLSETIGVTCVDTTAKAGFFLSKERYLIFSPGG